MDTHGPGYDKASDKKKDDGVCKRGKDGLCSGYPQDDAKYGPKECCNRYGYGLGYPECNNKSEYSTQYMPFLRQGRGRDQVEDQKNDRTCKKTNRLPPPLKPPLAGRQPWPDYRIFCFYIEHSPSYCHHIPIKSNIICQMSNQISNEE